MTTPKQKSLPVLIHELDAVFSRFIRLRDTKDGVIRCFICGAKLSFQEAQVMHYIDRDQMPTRYDERNCHSGCEECNCFDPNHKIRYSARMLFVYGQEEINRLFRKSRGLQKFFRFELEDLIEYYKSENRLSRVTQRAD